VNSVATPGRVQLVAHSGRWTGEFRVLAALAREALGNTALRIDHIGSTAVPGLVAKDVIDVQITLAALDPQSLAALEAAGFRPRGPRSDAPPPGAGWSLADGRKHLFAEPAGTRRANVHVRVQGHANQRLPLTMRDWLRAHPEAAAAYGEFKQRLAAAVSDPEDYATTKDPVFHLMAQAAEQWATKTGWHAGASDG
jgi:GrpB-like predicted nucleotidyltransferase (UPF0157 family)